MPEKGRRPRMGTRPAGWNQGNYEGPIAQPGAQGACPSGADQAVPAPTALTMRVSHGNVPPPVGVRPKWPYAAVGA